MDGRQRIVATLKALIDRVRLSVPEFWSPSSEEFCTEDGICAYGVQGFLGVTQPTVSYHTKIPVQAGS